MSLYIYIRRHLTPITKTHLSVITGFDPTLNFRLVDGTAVIDRAFRFIRTPKPGKLINVQLDSVLTDQRVGAFLIAGLVSRPKDVVIVPGLRTDPMLPPTHRAAGATLATLPAYAWSRQDEPGIVHYDVTEEPWKFRPDRTEGSTFHATSRAGDEIELTRPEVLCHELNHCEWHYRIRPMFEPAAGWTEAEVAERSNEFAIRRTNRYRAWKHKSEADEFQRADHSGFQRVHTRDSVTGEVSDDMGDAFDFSDVDTEEFIGPIEFDFAEED